MEAYSYIPRALLFTPQEVLAIKISPDSKHLAIVKSEKTGVMNLYTCPTSDCNQLSKLKQLTHFTTPEIYRFFWTGDSQSLVFLKDEDGSKSYQFYSLNIMASQLFGWRL
jgi:Tol biopolymer transport system component